MDQLTYHPRSSASRASVVAKEPLRSAAISITTGGAVVVQIQMGALDERIPLADMSALAVDALMRRAASARKGAVSARGELVSLAERGFDELARRRAETNRRRWEIREEYDTRDEQMLRCKLRFRSASTGPSGSAHFDLPVSHTYALVCATSGGIAVLLDEGFGHEDFVFDDSTNLRDPVETWIKNAAAGNRVAIQTLRSFAVHGIKALRAKRASEGRA